MWKDQVGVSVGDAEPYTAPDGTQYPGNFPKAEIPGLVWEADPVTPPTPEQIKAGIVDNLQMSLDRFARGRGYDSMLSACSYAGSSVPKFSTEGQYCVGLRDASWIALAAYMAEVLAGTKPMPTGFADVESILPVMAWPTT